MSVEDLRKRRVASSVKEVKEAIEEGEKPNIELLADREVKEEKLIPTGSTLLNLALSDNPKGGFYLGTISNIIGDSAAGKTFLLWTVFAEIVYDKKFKGYELDYDEPESSLAFNIRRLFGKKVEERVNLDSVSESVEGWHDNVMARATDTKPFIYGLDSLDAICDEDEIDRDIRKGSYGAKKPKLVSEIMRKIVQNVKGTLSSVFIISQTRDNIGVMFGDKKTRSGGKALKFFCTHELWLAVKGPIKRKDRNVGVEVRVKVGKNKLTGKLRIVEFPIYYDYGIDDTVSCIRFLVEEKVWSRKKGGEIDTKDPLLPEGLNEEELARHIEDNNLKDQLVQITTNTWREIEANIATNRKPKYADRS